MNLRQLIMDVDKDKIFEELVFFYPETEDQIDDYLKVYDNIIKLEELSINEFEIHIGFVDNSKGEDYEEDIDEESYVVVSGYDREKDIKFALGFIRWIEWMNAPIIVDSSLEISSESILAICIYEMTFYGFDEIAIERELEALEKGIGSDMFH